LRPAFAAPRGITENHGVGALTVQDTFQAGDRLNATVGGRFSYIGFLTHANQADPLASLELRRDAHTRVRATLSQRTLAPGGDLLTVSSLSASPALWFARMADGLQAERSRRYELAVEAQLGATTLRAETF